MIKLTRQLFTYRKKRSYNRNVACFNAASFQSIVLAIIGLTTNVLNGVPVTTSTTFESVKIDRVTRCFIPNQKENGTCLEASMCPPYVRLKALSDVTLDTSLEYLSSVHCENETIASEPLVCCPPNVKIEELNLRQVVVQRKKQKRRIPLVMENGVVSGECGKKVTNRIYGGEITELDEYPWMVLLVYNSNDYGCSGALISDVHVLTAAHCVQGIVFREKGGLKNVRLGEFNVRTDPDCIEEQNFLSCGNSALNVGVNKIWVHPEYDEFSADKFNDIAVLRMEKSVPFTHYIMPICLPYSHLDNLDNPLREGQIFTVLGWGRTDLFSKYLPNIRSPIKLKIRIPFVAETACRAFFQKHGVTVGPRQICAGGETAKDTCAGDSGGPLMYFDRKHYRWFVYGVVSYGFNECGLANHPGVYTNVESYMEWINETIQSPAL